MGEPGKYEWKSATSKGVFCKFWNVPNGGINKTASFQKEAKGAVVGWIFK